MGRMFVVLLHLLLLAAPALADTKIYTVKADDVDPVFETTIDGKTYSTGLRQRPEGGDLGVNYFSPGVPMMFDLPENYDAESQGRVTRVMNQGSCGSCWACARTASLESAFIIAGMADKTLDLAEQDTLVNDDNSYGCNGGFMDGRYEVNYGLSTEADCPYRASGRYGCDKPKFGKATRWAFVGDRSRRPTDDEVRAAIYQYGVAAVEVAAGGSFSPNGNGEILSCGSRSINHMVALTAWRKNPHGSGYQFKIKNSWGTGWGEGGYAWSTLGCNQLAAEALFFYRESEVQPVEIGLPVEIGMRKGDMIAIEVKAQKDIIFTWSTGAIGERIWVKPTASKSYTVSAKDPKGNVTTSTVAVVVNE